MPKVYLLDTCIWRDFYENRFSKSGKPYGKYAADLFIKILKNNDRIIFSETLFSELVKDYSEKSISDMLNILFLSKVLFRVEVTKKEFLEAFLLSKDRNLPFVDCLNAVLARNHNAILVSNDKHFFQGLSDIVKAVRTEQII